MRSFCRSSKEGALLFVRITPRSQQDKIQSLENIEGQERLKIKLRAIPSKGGANKSLCRLIARWLNIPRNTVSVVSGAAQRNKKILIAGDCDQLKETVEKRIMELS